jgi:hypothetical protein
MNTEDFDEELAIEELLNLVKSAKSCDKGALASLELHLKSIKSYVRALEADDEFTELMLDLEDEFSTILNDSNFRDECGSNASKCPELFELVHKYCCPLNENIEVVLALNKFIPVSVVKKLEKSDFSWEEDGTTQALARTTNDPELLKRLAKSEENSTRYEVALNQSTPPEVLSKLVHDCDISDSFWYCGNGFPTSLIQYAVVSNPCTPHAILAEVVSGGHKFTALQFADVHGFSLFNSKDELEINKSVMAKAEEMLKLAK